MSGTRLDLPKIEQTMQDGDIQAVSIASGANKDAIETTQRLIAADGSVTEFPPETVFGAASLSKPVFAYLVLNLVGTGNFTLDATKLNDIVPFADYCKEHDYLWDDSEQNKERVKLFTPAMALSHMTGLPIGYNKKDGLIKFDFEPGQGFAYSGVALMYLQECIEKHFKASLESLVKQYVFEPAGMKHSSFYPDYDLVHMSAQAPEKGKIYLEATDTGLQYQVIGQDGKLEMNTISWDKLPADFPRSIQEIIQKKDACLSSILDNTSEAGHTPKANAANSLRTTGSDYVSFCLDWMNNNNDNVQDAFKSKVTMTSDPWAVRENVPTKVLERLGCGYGWMLETNANGDITSAFHTGDMNEWRAGVKLDLNSRSATVLFTKSSSQNGHILQEQIFGKSNGLDCFFQKFRFARNINELKPDWRTNPSYGIKKDAPAQMYNRHRSSSTSVISKSFVPDGNVNVPSSRKTEKSAPNMPPKGSQQNLSQNPPLKPSSTSTQSSEAGVQKRNPSPTPCPTRPVPPWEKK